MKDRYEIRIKVLSQQGTCARGHKVGDEWVMSALTPEGICLGAFQVILPCSRVLMFGGSYPWEKDPAVTTIACPDAENPVVFELKRVSPS